MKKIGKVLGATVASMLAMCTASESMATTVVSCFVNRCDIIIATAYNSSFQPVDTVYFMRNRDNALDVACGSMGNQNGLSDDYVIQGGNATVAADDDAIVIVQQNFETGKCGYPYFGTLLYNGHYLDINGRAGNDYVSAGTGDTHIAGGDGNDIIYSKNGNAVLNGEQGNDFIFAQGVNNGEYLFGGPGNDCIFANSNCSSGRNASISCGDGSDTFRADNPDSTCENDGNCGQLDACVP